MMASDRLNILLVDDQAAKLLSYEAILGDLGENLVKANSAKQALELLLKLEIALVLVDVCMPDLDGFELAGLIRDHPRFQKTAIIFISAVLLSDVDRLRGYELGAVDYVPVPVIPEVLRAKVRIFTELYRKTRDLEKLNRELEKRVSERTLELASSNARLLETEHRRSLALAAGHMGSWEWNVATGEQIWDQGQYRICGVTPETFVPTANTIGVLIHTEDWPRVCAMLERTASEENQTVQMEFRVVRPTSEIRWCLGTAASTVHANGRVERVSGVTVDITERKQAEERQLLLAREVDHRARNALAVTQSILNLTRSPTLAGYQAAVRGRISALARAHSLLSESRWQGADMHKLAAEEFAPYGAGESGRVAVTGPPLTLKPSVAQSLALVIHELGTNAAKHGSLSVPGGRVALAWEARHDRIVLDWAESGGPECAPSPSEGLGTKIIATTIEKQLAGTAKFDWKAQGLRVQFTIPLGEKRPSRPVEPQVKTSVRPGRTETGPRILVVEDEALISLIMQNMLSELGFKVVGPFSNAAEATLAVRNQPVDAALLDVNLNGELVYGLADALQSSEVPFIFITGYAQETIDARFSHIPVLQKPIEPDELRTAIFTAVNATAHGAAAIEPSGGPNGNRFRAMPSREPPP